MARMKKRRIAKSRTGTQPSSNRAGLMGNLLGGENIRGMTATSPGMVMARGGSSKRVSKRRNK